MDYKELAREVLEVLKEREENHRNEAIFYILNQKVIDMPITDKTTYTQVSKRRNEHFEAIKVELIKLLEPDEVE